MKTRDFIMLFVIAVASVALLGQIVAWAQITGPGEAKAKASRDRASVWMKHKLISSQEILDGLTRGDFGKIEKNAQAMQVSGELEAWARADLPDYRAQLLAFAGANHSLVRSAREKNLDGATIAFTQLTISCVHCHRVVREGQSKED